MITDIYTQGSIVGFILGATSLLMGYGFNMTLKLFKVIAK